MTIFCFQCALVTVPPLLVFIAGLSAIMLSGLLVIAIWKGRGWAQAFAVGACVPHAFAIAAMFNAREPLQATFLLVAGELMAGGTGIVAAAFCGFLVRRNGLLPVPNVPFIRIWFVNDVVDTSPSDARVSPQNQSTSHDDNPLASV